MQLDCHYKTLLVNNDHDLKELVKKLSSDSWAKNQHRQKTFLAHKQTKSIVYVWSTFDDVDYNNVEVMTPRDHDQLSRVVWNIADAMLSNFGGRITKLMLAKLPASGTIAEHTDPGNLEKVHRCHYVIKTNKDCLFYIDNVAYNFEEGQAFELCNTLPHKVINKGKSDRIHLICDILDESYTTSI